MTIDETQLLARFKERFDTKSNQVLTLNKPSTVVDKSKPWVRFSVSLGDRFRQELGLDPAFLQLGGVYLQVFVPKALGVNGGDDLIQQFDDLFCEWTSPDGHLQIGRITRSMTDNDKEGLYQHTIRFAFQSLRTRT